MRWLGRIVVVFLALASPASATLRSPHLEASCAAGYVYGEHSFDGWTVEGCSKTAAAGAGVRERWLFRGDLEVNGMKFEIPDAGPDLTAKELDDGDGTLVRSATTTIVLDPLVGGTRKRFVIYSGAIDLSTGDRSDPGPSPLGSLVAQRARRAPRAAVGVETDYVDLPTNAAPKLFGLVLKGGLEGAAIRPQNGAIAATTVFDAELGLSSSGVSDLLALDATDELTVTDGVGLQVAGLRLDFPDVEVPGIGGLEDFHITYQSGEDTWQGGVDLDLGSLIGEIDFDAEVSAATGKVVSIATEASDLPPIPIGATGIVLDSVSFGFGLDPLTIDAGASATAGPKIAGTALILLDGDLHLELEPSFRLEVSGGARVLPAGSGELASGGFAFVYDADGLISVSGDARFEAAIAGVGIGAQIDGSGAYSTSSNRFNIEASASGDLLLGFLGDFNVARFQAVVSSSGFGTCGKLLGFLSGGIGQQWGHNLTVFTGCELGPFDTVVSRTTRRAGFSTRSFDVPEGARQVAVEVSADAPGPRVALRAPDGSLRVATTAGERRRVDADTVVMGKADADRQLIALRDPPPGRWTVAWRDGDPQVTGLRLARDVPALRATATVSDPRGARAGRRRVTVSRPGALGGDQVQYAIRTRAGLQELGPPTAAAQVAFGYDEHDARRHQIVAWRVRDGVPLPATRTVIARYRSRLPRRPAAVRQRRRGTRLTVLARLRPGSEPPDAWQYRFSAGPGRVVVHRGKVGRPLTIAVPRRIRRVRVAARPVVAGRALR